MKWTAGTTIVLVLGIFLQLGYLVYALYVLLGILVLSQLFTQHWKAAITATRSTAPERVEVNTQITMRILLSNSGRIGIPWLLFEESLPRKAMDQLPPCLTAKGKRMGILGLPSDESHVIEYTVKLKRRGYYQLGPLLVETGDLFGLHRTFKIIAEPAFVLVTPNVVPLNTYQIASNRPVGEIRIAHRLFEDPTRIAAVRPYQAGDPLNQIHWQATARTGDLHTRIYENSCVAGATLLLDFHEDAYEGSGATVTAELAITTAASLAHALFEEGQQVGFVSNGRDAAERIRLEGWKGEFTTRADAHQRAQDHAPNERLRPMVVPTRKGSDQLNTILETLGRLESSPGLSFVELVQEAIHYLPRDATVIPILRDASPATALALGMLRQRGYALTVIFIQFDEGHTPNWAQAPAWAESIVAEGIPFITVSNENELAELSTANFLQ